MGTKCFLCGLHVDGKSMYENFNPTEKISWPGAVLQLKCE